jgi:hypothetical protein
MRFRLHEAALARGKTLTEYLSGGPVRLEHIHEELAFDELKAMMDSTNQEIYTKDGGSESSGSPRKNRRGSAGDSN